MLPSIAKEINMYNRALKAPRWEMQKLLFY